MWKWPSSVGLGTAIVMMTASVGSLVFVGNPGAAWITSIVGFCAVAIVVGHGITGKLGGVLIAEDGRMSLSRFQLFLWTTLILSALFAAVFVNIKAKYGDNSAASLDPMDISIPANVWLSMCISTTSTLISKGIYAYFRLVIPNHTHAPSIGDLFSSETDSSKVDFVRVQNFFFTVILALGYGAVLWETMTHNETIMAFPDFSTGAVTLFGISHTGYLVNKGVRFIAPKKTPLGPMNQIDVKEKTV